MKNYISLRQLHTIIGGLRSPHFYPFSLFQQKRGFILIKLNLSPAQKSGQLRPAGRAAVPGDPARGDQERVERSAEGLDRDHRRGSQPHRGDELDAQQPGEKNNRFWCILV